MTDVALAGKATIPVTAASDLYANDVDGFSRMFAALADYKIITKLGDDIVFTAANGGLMTTKCILSARPGTGNKPGFEETENIWAKIDLYSTPIELLENLVPGISKSWTAFYKGATYAISEIIYRGNNTLTVILYHPGNLQATIGGWK
jgi:hypothetical protein